MKVMQKALSACGVLVLCSGSVVGEWQLDREEAGISVFYQPHSGSEYVEFNAETHVTAAVDQVLAVLRDAERCQDWLYLCEDARVLGRLNENDFYLYQVFDFPLLFSNRDLIVHVVIEPNTRGDDVRIRVTAANDYCQDNPLPRCRMTESGNHVRISELEAFYQLTRTAQDKTRLIWQQFVDPGGDMKPWLANDEIKKIPFESLQKLRALLPEGE